MKTRYNPLIVCPMCSYDANPLNASRCEICNQLLRRDRPSTRTFTIGWVLGGLLLLGGGLYFASKDLLKLPTTVSNTTTSDNESPTVNSEPNGNEIRYYNSMSEVQNVPDGLFNYGGATMFAALTANGMNEAIAQAHPQFRLRYVEPLNNNPSSSAGIAMLFNDELSFAHTSIPLKDADYTKAQNRGISLKQIPVAIDKIVFFTNPQLPIEGLAVDQLQAIYTGKVTNWQQLGGPNLPIVAVALDPKGTSTINILLDGLENQALSSRVQVVRDYTTSIRKVASTPGAIAYTSAALIVNQETVRPLPVAKAKSKQYVKPFINDRINMQAFNDSSYPLTRQLFVVLSHDGEPSHQAGVAYTNLLLSKEGQKIIERSGFIPLR